jgi:hypothetical protein
MKDTGKVAVKEERKEGKGKKRNERALWNSFFVWNYYLIYRICKCWAEILVPVGKKGFLC